MIRNIRIAMTYEEWVKWTTTTEEGREHHRLFKEMLDRTLKEAGTTLEELYGPPDLDLQARYAVEG